MDSADYLLSVLFDGSAIARIAPDGSLERLIPVPVPRPTSCAFGSDGRTLFVRRYGYRKIRFNNVGNNPNQKYWLYDTDSGENRWFYYWGRYNDFWNIRLPNEYEGLISIYDRYGKLLKQLSAQGQGWDGTFNGNLLPSTDYWFKVEYIENNQRKEFKSHFSLKR